MSNLKPGDLFIYNADLCKYIGNFTGGSSVEHVGDENWYEILEGPQKGECYVMLGKEEIHPLGNLYDVMEQVKAELDK